MLRFILFIISLIITHLALAQSLKGKVIRVSDGDTIALLDSTKTQVRIRLYGIDCPENGQDFANVAKRFTSDLCFSEIVTVDVKDIDRYGRTVGIVWTSDSINVNLELLREGLAWHYKHFDKSEEFEQAEHLARQNKKGLWIQSNAVAPWDYRRIKK
ncbi:nuclease [Sphingobacterium olei]|uniref:Nuclease n=1 Tax=Sphingobacterium olei TaxID=2571155 RepID=A0A4U0P761_9SPHI|nr:thermonuclease family protein [Sphingobacterium olei]TJZ63317.1 nuclease [Sphingobacterium olei]